MSGPEKYLFAVGWPFSPLYGALMMVRRKLYRRGMLRSYRLPVPVVSVGNLTWGGTGKTPMVIALARFLVASGRRPVILSRGYRGSGAGVLVVSDGRQLLADADEAGDEPRLLAEKLPGVPVVTARKRMAAARLALERFAPDLMLLDDGLQHLALQRDVDIVLFRGSSPLGNGRVFPGGPLREPLAALAGAHCFVATGEPFPARFADLLARKFPTIPRFDATYHPAGLVPAGFCPDLDSLRNRKVLAFCGIANPPSFRRLLDQLGVQVVDWLAFEDHHRYSAADTADLSCRFAASGADLLLTTEKDLVKLPAMQEPLCALAVELRPVDGLFAFLDQTLARL